MKINKELLSEMGACNDGMRWFLKNFKGDAELKEVIKSLLKDGRHSDLSWFNSNLLMRDNIDIKAYTDANVVTVVENTAIDDDDSNSGDNAQIGSSGDN
uniref:hypothetical protein n=1 Tax=Neisseria weixii TaxID=1853276 RepID=UPI0035A0D98C